MIGDSVTGREDWVYPYWQVPNIAPSTLPGITWPYAGNPPFPSRNQIEKELLQKIAHELHGFVDDKGYDWQGILEWVDEIIDEYDVEPTT